MSKLNRRAMIQGAIVAGAAGAITLTATRPSRAEGLSLALRRLCESFHDLHQKTLAADAKLGPAIESARKAWPVVPRIIRRPADPYPKPRCPVAPGYVYENGERQNYGAWTSKQCDWELEDLKRPSKARTEWLEMRAAALAYEADCQKVRDRFNVDALYAALVASAAARDAAIEVVATTTVSNVAELAMKASALAAAPPYFLMINAPRLAADAIALGAESA